MQRGAASLIGHGGKAPVVLQQLPEAVHIATLSGVGEFKTEIHEFSDVRRQALGVGFAYRVLSTGYRECGADHSAGPATCHLLRRGSPSPAPSDLHKSGPSTAVIARARPVPNEVREAPEAIRRDTAPLTGSGSQAPGLARGLRPLPMTGLLRRKALRLTP